ncbi:MAG TPA: DNA polymerase I [Chiayiivirga sp.]|nr:DNA polymerase I [Chiayiivirga sp.]
MKKLVLIDGSSYLYRAFHALPPLTAADGTPTGALFGVVNMLRSTLKAAPDYVAFVIDAPGPTFRDDLYPQYKANRPPMPDDLRAQIVPMLEIVAALGIPILRESGVEADDVIGTLALAANAEGIEVEISTSDKDFAQLVRPGLALLNTMTGQRMASDADVVAKFGVPAAQIIDYLSLTGDAVDNVPGVDKCGPKTAAKWLSTYGSLDGVMANADAIGGKVGENLRAALAHLPLSRTLVTIRTDVALACAPSDLALTTGDTDALRTLYRRFGFNQALRDLEGGAAGVGKVIEKEPAKARGTARAVQSVVTEAAPYSALAVAGVYETILSHEALMAWLERLRSAPLIAFDTETDSLDPMQAHLVGLSFAIEPGHAAYVPLAHNYPGAPAQLPMNEVLDALRPILEDAQRPKIGQNGKYDLHVMRQHGVAMAGLTQDSMLESFVLNSTATRHDLDSLAQRYLGYTTVAYTDIAGKGARQIPFAQVDLETAAHYAAEDADICLRLHRVLRPQLAASPRLDEVYQGIEMPLVEVLAQVEANGVLIDVAELHRQSRDLAARMLTAQTRAFELAGRNFNLDSPKQLQAVLFDELGLEPQFKTPTGQRSTNEEALEAIAEQHELPRLILDYRALAKLRSTYTDKLPEMVNPATGRVHTSYHQGGAATGRLSSSDPNLQNIPVRSEDGRRIRRAFIAPPARRIVAFDYSQIELRIMAHLSEDIGLIEAFERGLDIHRATAAEVFGVPLAAVEANQRRAAKAINFGLIYGMGAFGLARQIGVNRAEAQDYIALYFKRYPGVHAYMERTREAARAQGYVETVFGRRLYLTEIHSRNANQRAGAERAAINAPMQGTAADIIKLAMRQVHDWLVPHRNRAQMVMQVHDELVFEADEAFVETLIGGVRERMQDVVPLRVPLLVDVGTGANWDEAH